MKSSAPHLLMAVMLVLSGTPGCVGYKLGSSLPPDIKSIYVPTFANKCSEPLIENNATNATIAEFQKDGTLKIVRIEDADVTLECTLDSVTQTALRYNKSDKTKPDEYRLTLGASFTLKRTRTLEVIGQGTVVGEATFIFAGNLASAKRTAYPKASEDLAKRIVEKVVEIW